MVLSSISFRTITAAGIFNYFKMYKLANTSSRSVVKAGTIFAALLLIGISFSKDLFAAGQAVPEDPVFESESYVRHMPSARQENGSGGITIVESGTEQTLELKTFENLPVTLSINTQYVGMNEATDLHFPGYLTTAGVDIETTVPLLEVDKTFLRLGVNPTFYSDTWDFSADSLRIPLRSMLIYQPDDTLALLSGVAFYSDFENKFYPILGFIYKPNDRLTLNITSEDPRITYTLNSKTDLFVEGSAWLDEEFNTTRDRVKNAVLEYREISYGGGVEHKFNEHLAVSFSVGGVTNRVIKYKNSPDVIKIADGFYTELKFDIKM